MIANWRVVRFVRDNAADGERVLESHLSALRV